MKLDNISTKIIAIAFIGGACFAASLLVLGLVNERQTRFSEAKQEITQGWSKQQVIAGPMLVKTLPAQNINTYVLPTLPAQDINTYILPETLNYEVMLEPAIRSRGIFKSVIYTGKIKVSGTFSGNDIARKDGDPGTAIFSLPITDTRGIEKQLDLMWNDAKYSFEPGPGVAFQESSGLHANVPINWNREKVSFAYELELKGSEGISIAPVGKETIITMSSSWQSPKFMGAFLPSQREISETGFHAEWKISSFGRSYPQTWENNAVSPQQLIDSSAGVELHVEIDGYDMTFRSVKYAILFIVITFAAFFLFDILARVRIHPIQYLLIGSALSLFYLLLLSFSEQFGFLKAYLTATVMTALLITAYSAFVLKNKRRAFPIFVLLVVLYGYLYFVLMLEDYALIFGSLLLFVLLAVVMYSTRNIDWFLLGKGKDENL